MSKEAICQEILELSKKSQKAEEFVKDFLKVNNINSLEECNNFYALSVVLSVLKVGEL